MICTLCKDRRHELCRRGTWCDCQHRVGPDEAWQELVRLGQEMDADPPKGHVCSRECNHGRPDL